MSHRVNFKTSITNPETLARACDRMRAAGLAVVGPRSVSGHARTAAQGGGVHDAQLVQLPGWRGQCTFFCDERGSMIADNYSPYTNESHPEVKAGRKRVGEDGRWGDIKFLDRLQMEYRAAAIEAALPGIGGTVVSTTVDEQNGVMELVVETA